MIYHITHQADWEAAQARGDYQAESLATQGFIHASNAHQVALVANAIYTGFTDLVLLHIDETRVTAPLIREAPDGAVPAEHQADDLFPHIYGALNLDAVVDVVPFLPDADGQFRF